MKLFSRFVKIIAKKFYKYYQIFQNNVTQVFFTAEIIKKYLDLFKIDFY